MELLQYHDRYVTTDMSTGVEDWSVTQSDHSSLLVTREVFVSGNDEGIHVADAASRSQDAVSLTPANDVSHLEQHLVLHHDEHRSYLIGEHVGIGCGGQPLPRHAHNVQTLGQLVEEMRVTSPHLVSESCSTVGHHLVQTEASVGEAEVHGLGDLGGVMEVQHIAVPIIGLTNEVQQNFNNSIEKLVCDLSSLRTAHMRENIYIYLYQC